MERGSILLGYINGTNCSIFRAEGEKHNLQHFNDIMKANLEVLGVVVMPKIQGNPKTFKIRHYNFKCFYVEIDICTTVVETNLGAYTTKVEIDPNKILYAIIELFKNNSLIVVKEKWDRAYKTA